MIGGRAVLQLAIAPAQKLGASFKKIKHQIYKDHPDGFYVRAKPNPRSPDITIKYISRYLGRPVIATSRIDAYDGTSVTSTISAMRTMKL